MSDTPDIERTLARLETMTSWLDDRFTLPGTNVRFGLDPVLGLIPGIVDTATALLTLYMILVARTHRLPVGLQAAMVGNLVLDWAVGSVPVLGDLFDVGFKANRRNLTLLKRYLGRISD